MPSTKPEWCFQKLKTIRIRFERYFLSPSIYLLTVVYILVLIIVFSLLVANLHLEIAEEPPRLVANVNNFVFDFIGIDIAKVSEPMNTKLVSRGLALLVALVSLMTVISPILWYFNRRREIKEAHIVERIDISDPGNDDIKTLSKLLNGAKKATIYSGSFHWILSPHIKKSILKLADKQAIQLVTSRSKDVVEEAWKKYDLDEVERIRGRLIEDNENDISLTFIVYQSSQRACCTMVPKSYGTGDTGDINLIIRSSKMGGDTIVDIISNLVDKEFAH